MSSSTCRSTSTRFWSARRNLTFPAGRQSSRRGWLGIRHFLSWSCPTTIISSNGCIHPGSGCGINTSSRATQITTLSGETKRWWKRSNNRRLISLIMKIRGDCRRRWLIVWISTIRPGVSWCLMWVKHPLKRNVGCGCLHDTHISPVYSDYQEQTVGDLWRWVTCLISE